MASDDLFHARLDQMIDLRHPLVVLARRMPWSQIEAALGPVFARKNGSGKAVEVDGMFDPMPTIAGAGASTARRPRLSI